MTWRTNPEGLMRRARIEFGDWLSRPPWDWYTTHTFKADYVSPAAADRSWYAWFNSLRATAKEDGLSPSIYGSQAPFYFRVAEYQSRGTLHFHSLIGGVGDIRRRAYKHLWSLNGFGQVEKYDPGLGANFYVAKYLNKTDGEVRLSHNLTGYLTK